MKRAGPLFAPLLCLAAALAMQGCSVGRLPNPGPGGDFDWRMFGGDPGRTNASAARPMPPLRPGWEADAGSGFGPFSPALSESTIYVATLTGEVRALNLGDGTDRGSVGFGASIFGTPVIFSGHLYAALSGEENNLVSYDLRAGTARWSVAAGDVESSLLAAGGGIVAAGLDGSLAMYEPVTGRELWKYSPPGRIFSRSSPASDGTRVLYGSDGGVVTAVELATGKFLWQASLGGAVFTTPVISGPRAYVTSKSGMVYAIETATGAISWKRDLGSPLYGSPAVGEGRVFAGTSGGEVVALATADGGVIWKRAVTGAVGSAPLVCGEVLYVGDLAKNLYALSSADGGILWQYALPGRVRCTPVAVPGALIVLCEDRTVLSFVEDR